MVLLLYTESPHPLIPAEAGIQSLPNNESFPMPPFSLSLDSRLRGNERSLG